jgi:hypothetical protein
MEYPSFKRYHLPTGPDKGDNAMPRHPRRRQIPNVKSGAECQPETFRAEDQRPIVAAPADVNNRAAKLSVELIRMVEAAPYRGFERQTSFIGPETTRRTRQIGEELHTLGGKTLMDIVHSVVLARTDRLSAAMLNFSWDGIGEWTA